MYNSQTHKTKVSIIRQMRVVSVAYYYVKSNNELIKKQINYKQNTKR